MMKSKQAFRYLLEKLLGLPLGICMASLDGLLVLTLDQIEPLKVSLHEQIVEMVIQFRDGFLIRLSIKENLQKSVETALRIKIFP